MIMMIEGDAPASRALAPVFRVSGLLFSRVLGSVWSMGTVTTDSDVLSESEAIPQNLNSQAWLRRPGRSSEH